MNTIVVDCHGLCHRAKHSMGDLEYDLQRTGVIFGFMSEMYRLAKSFNPCKFVFAWDSKDSLRKMVYPQYGRHHDGEEYTEEDIIAFEQFSTIRDVVIPEMGFANSFLYSGLEADDIIASVVKNYAGKFIIVSSDHDLYQLLAQNVEIYSPYSKKMMTHSEFYAKWGILPIKWAEVKAYAGCNSDNVPGIERVGEVTAAKFLRKALRPTTQAYKDILLNQELFERNMKLVKIPFEGTPTPVINNEERLSLDGFLRVCQRYGFTSMLDKESIRLWKQLFDLT